MVVNAAQTSYDPRFIRQLFPDSDTYKHSALAQLYDVDLDKLDDLPQEKYKLFEECSPLHHLTKDDAPAMLNYGGTLDQAVTNQNIGIHHARFGEVLKEKMDALGIRCIVNAGGTVLGGAERISPIDFLKDDFSIAKSVTVEYLNTKGASHKETYEYRPLNTDETSEVAKQCYLNGFGLAEPTDH